MGLFQSPQNVETNKMRSWEEQLQDGTEVTVNNRLDCIGDTYSTPAEIEEKHQGNGIWRNCRSFD